MEAFECVLSALGAFDTLGKLVSIIPMLWYDQHNGIKHGLSSMSNGRSAPYRDNLVLTDALRESRESENLGV